jgi:hypothetical protein
LLTLQSLDVDFGVDLAVDEVLRGIPSTVMLCVSVRGEAIGFFAGMSNFYSQGSEGERHMAVNERGIELNTHLDEMDSRLDRAT